MTAFEGPVVVHVGATSGVLIVTGPAVGGHVLAGQQRGRRREWWLLD
jgi:hypothetical protein